jgi:hypothetical protein
MLCEACDQGIVKEIIKGIFGEVWSEFKWYIISGVIVLSSTLFFTLRFIVHHVKIF